MAGGTGNDTYVVDDIGDSVVERRQRHRPVQSSVTFTLAANVENLTLTGGANINGTGNTLGNILVGNTGNNTLNGGAGADSTGRRRRQRHLRRWTTSATASSSRRAAAPTWCRAR